MIPFWKTVRDNLYVTILNADISFRCDRKNISGESKTVWYFPPGFFLVRITHTRRIRFLTEIGASRTKLQRFVMNAISYNCLRFGFAKRDNNHLDIETDKRMQKHYHARLSAKLAFGFLFPSNLRKAKRVISTNGWILLSP